MLGEIIRHKWLIKNTIGILLLVLGITLAQRFELGLWIVPMVFPGILIILGWNKPTLRDIKNI